ncbi:MAG: HlyD family efflux transporter periplasmic adaptor subunit [Pseudomonadales bacterium]|jgi:HlyD family secretion protein|nr:HlyD family efflux transporter periplasmic adaptor subunit [Pseudomonadales bacterium]MDP7358847.1 HlyD family efflux transporter periplasmic adaptor subunit [Pseudomonadales bacterium]MDP7594373.1 HlyD family efflux transporter periplasmic adaptor subunit [Pseudomonadales bacterium]HJN49072.1 HlyD family efflux transporter periplasmic adaptor subunit [Pseudomonadales bacterium]
MDRPIEQKQWPVSRIITYSVTGLLVIGLGYSAISSSGKSRLNVDVARISVSQVSQGEFEEYIPIIGSVQPRTTVYLDLQEGGIVEEVFIASGSWVDKGDVILRFNNTNVQKNTIDSETRILENLNQLRNSKISLTEKNLILKDQLLDLNYRILDLEKDYKRFITLKEQPNTTISQQQFESTKDELEYLKNKRGLLTERIRQESILREQQNRQVDDSIDRVNRSLEVLSRIVDSLEVRAPISGYLSAMRAEIGQSFTKGHRIGQVDRLDVFKVIANIDQFYISKVEVSQQGSFDFDGQQYQLKVIKIYPEVTNDAFQVDMGFAGTVADGIKRGQSLQIDLSLSETNTSTLVTKGGFYRHTNGRWVYRLTDDGSAAYRVAVVPGRQNPKSFEVLEGLETGDWIISSSYDLFRDADELTFSEPINR